MVVRKHWQLGQVNTLGDHARSTPTLQVKRATPVDGVRKLAILNERVTAEQQSGAASIGDTEHHHFCA